MLLKTGVPFHCPSCKNRLVFKSEMSTALVCPWCNSINHRANIDGAILPKADAVKEDMSVLRVGTTGQYQGLSFEVLGRIQHFFKKGYRNHWYVLTGKGEEFWLGDWAGNYSFFKEVPAPSQAAFNKTKPGNVIRLNNISFYVEMLDQEVETFLEGEVPHLQAKEQNYIRVELLQQESYGLAIANIYSKNNIQVYLGQYQYLEDLQLQNLRAHHEWI